jgi:capsular exopolysaccharide synthesis family protein
VSSSAGFRENTQERPPYLGALREHWLGIVVLVVAAVAVTAAYSLTATKRYEAETDILVSPVAGSDTTFLGFSLLRATSDLTRPVLTAARLVTTPQVADAVRRSVGEGATRQKLLDSITVTPISQSDIVSIRAKSSNPKRAAAIANAFATALINQRTALFQRELGRTMSRLQDAVAAIPAGERTSPQAYALETRLGDLQGLVGAHDPTLQVLSPATVPTSASWPRPVLSVVVAFVAALLLGSGGAIALELVSPRVAREDELLFVQRLPILARVPRMSRRVASAYLSGAQPLPPEVREAYRTLRASLTSPGREASFPQSILITSALPREGKTMTSVNLALTLAASGVRVILVDGDLRRPMVGTVFGIAAHRSGFARVLSGVSAVEDELVPAPGNGDQLRLLLSSPEHMSVVDLLEPHHVERVLAELRLYADVVVIDSPPLTEVADALTLADEAEAVVVAVRLGRTRRDRLDELRRMLSRRGIAPVGFVVMMRKRLHGQSYYYGRRDRPPEVELSWSEDGGDQMLAQYRVDND